MEEVSVKPTPASSSVKLGASVAWSTQGAPLLRREEIHYTEADLLGRGGFGSVYAGMCRGMKVAVKVPNADIVNQEELDEFRQEVASMAAMHHPRIALFLGACLEERVHIVMELLNEDLETLLLRDAQAGKKLSLFQRMEWAKQSAEGLAWLHGAGIIHRDVKPTNMLYHAASRSVKISDFGLAALLGKNEQLETGQIVGNPRYWAPESIERKPYTKATDVYSWAISMAMFVTRKHAFPEYWESGEMSMNFLEAILDLNVRPELPENRFKCPPALRALLTRSWSANPVDRPTFPQIIDELESHILLSCAVFDETAARFWAHQVCNLNKAPGLHREVSYALLSDMLESMSVPADSEKHREFGMYALYKMMCDQWDPFGNEITTLEHFGRTLGFFCPIGAVGSGKFIADLIHKCHQHWFWGHSSRFEATMYLKTCVPGTFIARCANESQYRMSVRTATGVVHFRVEHEYQSERYELKKTLDLPHKSPVLGHVYPSLPELASAISRELNGCDAVVPERSPFMLCK